MKCIKCNKKIHPKRLKALPKTKTCVECSTTDTYCAVTTTHGSGDHTWNDIQIMTKEQYNKYTEAEKKLKNWNPESTDSISEDDDSNLQGPFIIGEETDL